MRNRLIPLLLLPAAFYAFSCCVSCTEHSPVEEPSAEPSAEPEKSADPKPAYEGPKPGTYTFTVSPLKGRWEAGDEIYIHGSYGPAARTVTLTADAISADGKTASVALDGDLFEFPLQPDGLYAASPAGAVKPQDDVIGAETEFQDTTVPLSLAYLSGSDFAFKDISSAISFQVPEGYARFAFAGNRRPGLRFISYNTSYTSDAPATSSKKTDGYPFLTGPLTGQTVTLWFPGGMTFKDGITVYLGTEDGWPAACSIPQEVKLKAGDRTELGELTFLPYDGPEPKMPEMGARTKYTVSLNEMSGICLSEDGSFLWAVGDNGHLGRISLTGEVLESRSIGGDLEDITRDPRTGDLLLGLEPDGVGIIEAPEFTGKLRTLFSIPDAKRYGNAGLEGLTYYRDGLVYAGTQTGSDLFLCDLATGEVRWKKRLVESFPEITEIGGLCYDPLTDWLWIIDSESQRFFALTGDAESLLGAYSVKGVSNAESICVDHARSCIWVGDDYGSTSHLYRYDFTGLDEAVVSDSK